MSPSIEQEDAR